MNTTTLAQLATDYGYQNGAAVAGALDVEYTGEAQEVDEAFAREVLDILAEQAADRA